MFRVCRCLLQVVVCLQRQVLWDGLSTFLLDMQMVPANLGMALEGFKLESINTWASFFWSQLQNSEQLMKEESVLCFQLGLRLKLLRGLSHDSKCTFGSEMLTAKQFLQVVLNILWLLVFLSSLIATFTLLFVLLLYHGIILTLK